MDNCASFSLWWKGEGFLFRWVWATVQNSLCWKGEGSHFKWVWTPVHGFHWKGEGFLFRWVWAPVHGFPCVGRVRDLSTGGSGHLNEVCVCVL